MNIAVILGGGGQYVFGFGNKAMAIGLYDHVFPELRDDVLQIGSGREINFETVLQVGADLAILPERFAALADDFENIGIPAAVILPNAESFDTIKNSVTMLGTLLGEDERAAQINAFFDSRIAAAQGIAARITEQPRAMFTGGSSPATVANGSMLQSVILETAGAVNVARDVAGTGGFVEVDIEEIIGWDPEIIFIPAYASFTVEELLGDPAWASIQAVRDGKVFVFPSHLDPWDFPTPSVAMGLVWLLNNLFPELYSMEQVIRDANEYYQLVFGQTFTAEQLGIR
jgi:iron complex transport system substrate-binding protein